METQKVTKSWLLGFVKAAIANFVLMILNRRYGITITPSGNSEADACQAIQIATMRERVQAEDMMERTADKYTSGAMDRLKEAICEGMNIECGESATLSDLFALIDTSVSDRISKSLHLRNVAANHPMGEGNWEGSFKRLLFHTETLINMLRQKGVSDNLYTFAEIRELADDVGCEMRIGFAPIIHKERDWRADCEELEKMIREYWNHNVYGERGNDDAVLHRESRLELIRNFDAYQKARKEA